ncbi:MAG: 2-hydroxymuconate tautomerase [Acetobacterales bacterium]
MPFIHVHLTEGRSDEQKKKVAEAITDAMDKHMGAPREATSVIFSDVAPNDWVVGGKTLAERKKAAGS